jgi:hypothetical protein
MKRRKPLMIGGACLHALGWWIWIASGPLPAGGSPMPCASPWAVTASLTLSWACAKEVNPPLLSGMATSVVNVGVFLGPSILQPLVGWVMDQGWQGAMDGGARLYAASDYRGGLILMAAFAALGAAATFFVRETGCRNIYRRRKMKAILLYGHGARNPEWAQPFHRIRDAIKAREASRPGRPTQISMIASMRLSRSSLMRNTLRAAWGKSPAERGSSSIETASRHRPRNPVVVRVPEQSTYRLELLQGGEEFLIGFIEAQVDTWRRGCHAG